MKIHKEGYIILLSTFAFVIIAYLLFLYFCHNLILNIVVSVVALFTLFVAVRFFRVPARVVNVTQSGVLAPADGTIVDISECTEDEYLKERCVRISIFMSVWNVHVNSFPIDGVVSYKKYHPGKHLVAFYPKSSIYNEHNSIAVKNDNGVEILFRQIAGILARRIVSKCNVGDEVKQGTEAGIIKLGSRVDVFVPLESQINVNIGNKVRSQKTVLAYFE